MRFAAAVVLELLALLVGVPGVLLVRACRWLAAKSREVRA